MTLLNGEQRYQYMDVTESHHSETSVTNRHRELLEITMITNLINEKLICLDLQATTKDAVFREMIELLAAQGKVSGGYRYQPQRLPDWRHRLPGWYCTYLSGCRGAGESSERVRYKIKVETNGSIGVKNAPTAEEIAKADAIIWSDSPPVRPIFYKGVYLISTGNRLGPQVPG